MTSELKKAKPGPVKRTDRPKQYTIHIPETVVQRIARLRGEHSGAVQEYIYELLEIGK